MVRGTATVTPGPNPELLDELAMKSAGLHHHPLALRDSPDSAVVRVAIDRISVGPWIDESPY